METKLCPACGEPLEDEELCGDCGKLICFLCINDHVKFCATRRRLKAARVKYGYE